jgi:quinol monooxygenase YgiN
MISRASFLTLLAAAALSSRADGAASGDEVFHVAIFRFAKEHADDAIAAFRAIASASRKESGNLRYDIYRGTDDDLEFYIAEHWASQAALAAHERTEAFIRFGQGVLMKHATLHEAVTARAFDVGQGPR